MSHRITKARQVKVEILAAMDAHRWISDRDRIIIKRVLDGESYRSVAKDFDVGTERIRGICIYTFREKLRLDV